MHPALAFGAALSLLAGPALALDAPLAERPVGMVERPCAELPPKPPAVTAFEAAFIAPRKADLPRLLALTKDPDYIAWTAAKQARDATDPNGLCAYAAANAALRASGRRPQVVFLGDSITENWVRGDPALFSDGRIGRGIGGQTTAQMLVRFHADVVSLRPRTVHIMAGTNDVAGNGGPTTQQAFQDNIEAMVEIARAHGIRVALGAIPPARRFFWRPEVRPADQIVRLNAWLRDFAARKGLAFLDYHAALATPDGGMQPAFAMDGVHPNRDGYAAMRGLARQVE